MIGINTQFQIMTLNINELNFSVKGIDHQFGDNRIHIFVVLKDVCNYSKETQPKGKRMEKTNGTRK